MFVRVAQPPVDPARRNPERHEFWTGFVLVLIAALCLIAGSQHVTDVGSVGGDNATEYQLIRAFSSGGLQYPSQAAAWAPPKPTEDPEATAAALDRWARDQGSSSRHRWQVRVDLGARTPCPT